MTSIYSSISIETGLVTYFSGYKTVILHEKAILYVLNHDFRFFAYRNITKFCRSIHFALLNLMYQRNSQQLLILFILRNRHKNFYCIYPPVKKQLRAHRAIVSYLVLKSPQFQTREGNFLLYL